MDQAQLPKINDVPLIYPLMQVSFLTVLNVDGVPVKTEGAELFDLSKGDEAMRVLFGKMLQDFRVYVKKLKATRLTPDVLQRIRDSQPPAALNTAADPQASLPLEQPADQGSGLTGSPVAIPDTAAASADTPVEGTTQSE